HTKNSDGKHSTAEVLEMLKKSRAQDLGFAVLTDHDGVAGYQEFAEGVKDWWKPICASELSCTYEDPKFPKGSIELHLLMYGIDPAEKELQEKFEKFKEERRLRFFRICDRVKAAGYKIDPESIAKKHTGVLGRPHVADALVAAGAVKTRSEAFELFLGDGKPFDVKKWRFPLEDAVNYAKKFGCKTSIAHPGQYGFKEEILKRFKDMGVDAIEVYHPRHDPENFRYYSECAKRLGFKISGGSDFHTFETDRVGDEPSLGRTQYPLEEAKNFLGAMI
ncbi:MAG: hypothetical protein J0M01_08390, partial [Dechloromonas sp.]|nr:hypothetical protein [Dechloromonas sp.]